MKTQTKISQELTDELSKLISFSPTSDNLVAISQLLIYVQEKLIRLGIKVKVHEHNGALTLIAGTKDIHKSKVLLQSHIDVVPAESKDFSARIENDNLIGRGSYDMLFGAASFIVMLENLSQNNTLDNFDIGLMLTSDEEVGGFNSAKIFAKEVTTDVCILPDAGGLDSLSISAQGIIQIELTIYGKSGHAARPNEYDNPIEKLPKIISSIQKAFNNSNPDDTTCSITQVHGGVASNQVPDSVVMILDVRHPASDSSESIVSRITDAIKPELIDIKVLVDEASFELDKNNQFVKEYINTHKQITNRDMDFMNSFGSSDARFFDSSIPIIMTRPTGGNMHGKNEFVSIPSLVEFFTVLQTYVEKFAKIRGNDD